MWAFHACFQALVLTVGTRHQIALRPGKYVDHEADEIQEEDQRHPKNRAVHTARLGVSGYPHQQGDADRQKNDGN